MKTCVIIENGKTVIQLKAENDFETDVLDKLYRKQAELKARTDAKYNYGQYDNHVINIEITDKKE